MDKLSTNIANENKTTWIFTSRYPEIRIKRSDNRIITTVIKEKLTDIAGQEKYMMKMIRTEYDDNGTVMSISNGVL